ncbi:hypothetical protein [Neomegalonema perideroedes]|uniref:hypothetical protein n=1 Tax=Neomegalonema perideroedes TaxID=217219 RepID=UPI0003740311|nr:hypothetical protein [Neomegalonema perideroedes]
MRKFLTAALFLTVAPLPAYAVQSGGYSLTISAGAEDGNGYVRLRDGQTYQICLRSQRAERSDVELSVDGLSVGTFRLNPYSNVCLERPSGSRGQFTFYKADSFGGISSGSGVVSQQQRGRISARFIPERNLSPMAPMARSGGAPHSTLAMPQIEGLARSAAPTAQQFDPNLSSGVTGLTGQSSQQFAQTQPIQRDQARAVTLELRLVHDLRQEPAPLATWPQPQPFPTTPPVTTWPQPQPQPPIATWPQPQPPVVTWPQPQPQPPVVTWPQPQPPVVTWPQPQPRPPIYYSAPPQPQPLPGRFDVPAPAPLWR